MKMWRVNPDVKMSEVGNNNPVPSYFAACCLIMVISVLTPLCQSQVRGVSGANLLAFLLYAPLAGILFFFPLDLIQIHKYTATQAGAALLPLILLIFVLSHCSGGLVARYGARLPLTIGTLVVALGFALLSRAGTGGSYWSTFFPAIVVLGVGMAISVAPLTTTVMESVPSSEAGVASGVNMPCRASPDSWPSQYLVWFFRPDSIVRSIAASHRCSYPLLRRVEAQRSKMAAAQIGNVLVKRAFDEAFLAGYRQVIWISVGLVLLSTLTAQMIDRKGTFHGPPVKRGNIKRTSWTNASDCPSSRTGRCAH